MIEINGRKFMNIQEAVQWLLENNALPFMCKADYAADTIIAKSEIVNPSPAELKVGAVVYFHDCKIAVVTGIASNGFKVGSDHIDMREGLFDGDIQIGGDLNVDGDAQLYEKIVDKDGHKRFIEGNIVTPEETGVTFEYARWSLSGSHLMIVIAGTVTAGNNASVSLNTPIDLPSWVKDKLTVLGEGDNIVYSDVYIYDNTSARISSTPAILVKSGTDILIYHSSITPEVGSDSASFRMQFDALIDNE